MIYRIFVEKKENLQAKKIREDLDAQLGIGVEDLRELIRYDVEGISEEELNAAIVNVFSEPPVDNVWREELPVGSVILIEAGWQYRPEGWEADPSAHVRPGRGALPPSCWRGRCLLPHGRSEHASAQAHRQILQDGPRA